MSTLLESLLTPAQRAQADRIDAAGGGQTAAEVAHRALRAAQAAHPVLVAAQNCLDRKESARAARALAWAKKWPPLSPQESAAFIADMPRAAAQAALFSTIERALQTANVCQRLGYDEAYGHFNAHPADPRTDDDAFLSADDARDLATDHVLSYAESVADWLASECETPAGRLPLDVSALSAVQVIEGTPATLLAVLMTGDKTQALRALYRLRELAGRKFAAEVDERAQLELAL